jgi:phage major head subunit gpT-like protein
MAMLNNRDSFPDLYLSDMLPELSNVIIDKYNSLPDMIQTLFNYHKTDRSIEQSTKVTGFGVAPQIPEGEEVQYHEFKQGYDKTYTMIKYGLGFMATEEMVDDGKFDVMGKLSRMIGKSVFETRQIRAFNIFNNGFATAGPDGVSLFNASHPLVGGGTASNTASSDLTVAALEAAITNFESILDDEGLHIGIKPKYLLVPPALKFRAKEIVASASKSGTANNDINALMDEDLIVISSPYLTDAGQWVLLAEKDEHELHFYDRKVPTVSGAFDFDTDSGKTKMKTRFDVGFSDWFGTYSAT